MTKLAEALAEFERVNRDDFWSAPREQWTIRLPIDQAAALVASAKAAQVGIVMRLAQKQYFKTRDRSDLIKSKELEKKFDTLAAEALK